MIPLKGKSLKKIPFTQFVNSVHIGPAKTTNNGGVTMNAFPNATKPLPAFRSARGKKQPRHQTLPGGGAQPGAIVGRGNFLTAQTKKMMMSVHTNVLAGILKIDRQVYKIPVKHGNAGLTALFTGVSKNSVFRTLAEFNAFAAAQLDGPAAVEFADPSPHGPVPMKTDEKVKKVTFLNPDIIPSIRRLIDIEHKGFRAVTCRKLVRLLKEQSEEAGGQICTTISAVRRILKVMGYVFGAAGRVHYQKETPGNVAYRYQYLSSHQTCWYMPQNRCERSQRR